MAITTTKHTSGWETSFDQVGAGPVIAGRQLVGSIAFSGASAGITVEAWLGGVWTPLGPEITADMDFTRFNDTILRDYQFRFRCSTHTSGTVLCRYDVGR